MSCHFFGKLRSSTTLLTCLLMLEVMGYGDQPLQIEVLGPKKIARPDLTELPPPTKPSKTSGYLKQLGEGPWKWNLNAKASLLHNSNVTEAPDNSATLSRRGGSAFESRILLKFQQRKKQKTVFSLSSMNKTQFEDGLEIYDRRNHSLGMESSFPLKGALSSRWGLKADFDELFFTGKARPAILSQTLYSRLILPKMSITGHPTVYPMVQLNMTRRDYINTYSTDSQSKSRDSWSPSVNLRMIWMKLPKTPFKMISTGIDLSRGLSSSSTQDFLQTRASVFLQTRFGLKGNLLYQHRFNSDYLGLKREDDRFSAEVGYQKVSKDKKRTFYLNVNIARQESSITEFTFDNLKMTAGMELLR